MLKWLKRIGLSLLIIIVLLAVWIHIGSIDQESFDDRGLLSEIKPVPDTQNGFLIISYLDSEDFEFKDIDEDFTIRKLASGEAWNLAVAEKLVVANQSVLDNIRKANQRPAFATPDVHGDPIKIPIYGKIFDATRLLVIESRLAVQEMDFDKAIASAGEALMFSSRIKSDESGYLISFMIGNAMEGIVIGWIHEMISGHQLSSQQYQETMLLLKKIPDYRHDNFENVFASEFRFGKDLMENVTRQSISERFESFRGMRDVADDNEKTSIGELAYMFLTSMLPEFYVHQNRIMSKSAVSMAEMASLAREYCNHIPIPVNDPGNAEYGNYFTWNDLITPNAQGIIWHQESELYATYFARRCLSHVYLDAVKTAVAIKAYEKQHAGVLPEKLDALVPNYLENLPIDYFDGETLRYSPEKQWLYSVGADYKDDGGSADGFYQGRCKEEEACYNNPTIPLVAPQFAQ
jgi:hypothetical protein